MALVTRMNELENVDFYQSDARSKALHTILRQKYGRFETIMSDMAPNFSGTLFETHSESMELNKLCLELCISLGSAGCNLVMKTIEGEKEKQLVTLLEVFFKEVFRFKPKSSRKESAEHYIVCKQLDIAHLNQANIIGNLQKLEFGSRKSKKELQAYFS